MPSGPEFLWALLNKFMKLLWYIAQLLVLAPIMYFLIKWLFSV